MHIVARGEMTTRYEVVLIVWGVGVSMKHCTHMKIIILKPPKKRNFRYHQGIKVYGNEDEAVLTSCIHGLGFGFDKDLL